jgi:Holliday junction resolvase RusA-like endonuclease
MFLVIFGVVYSMKNSKIARRGGFPVKHPKCRKFEQDFMAQVPPSASKNALQGPLRAIVTAFYPDRRQDLSCEIVYDLLQKSGVIKNDSQVIEKHEFREIDKKNPRVEITIEPL